LDYFRDDKDRICQVLTWNHPVDKRICIVKYDQGISHWTSRETGLQYQRILKSYSLEGQMDNLERVKKIEPSYFYHSKVYDADFLAVPLERIKKYYYPEERLQSILDRSRNDRIENRVKILTELLHDHLHIKLDDMGITGSILWEGQTEKSDIDLMIYGNKYAQTFNRRFPEIYENYNEISPMIPEKRQRYEISLSKKSGLPQKITSKYIKMKTWLSVFNTTDLSMIFSPKPSEIPFQYNDQTFKAIKPVDVECTISNSDLGSAYPSIYEISEYKILTKGLEEVESSLQRILSFEGALTGYFTKNDIVVVRGLLEEVTDHKKKKKFHQVILGTKECRGNEFILFKEDYNKL
jgi:predicted nucleotidyltransferase